MKFSYTLPSLLATASALDIRFGPFAGCGSWSMACVNINPGICCYVSQFYGTVQFAAVPYAWTIRKSGYGNTDCAGNPYRESTARGDTCLDAASYYGGVYNFYTNGKRDGVAGAVSSSQRVDFVVNDELGLKYSIKHLDDTQFAYLNEQFKNKTAGAIEAAIKRLKLTLAKE